MSAIIVKDLVKRYARFTTHSRGTLIPGDDLAVLAGWVVGGLLVSPSARTGHGGTHHAPFGSIKEMKKREEKGAREGVRWGEKKWARAGQSLTADRPAACL